MNTITETKIDLKNKNRMRKFVRKLELQINEFFQMLQQRKCGKIQNPEHNKARGK